MPYSKQPARAPRRRRDTWWLIATLAVDLAVLAIVAAFAYGVATTVL